MGTGVARLTPGIEVTRDPRPASDSGRRRSPARSTHWGFVAHPDLPDGPGPAFLLVALRPAPTLQHYDPEAVDYWVTEDGRGSRRTLTHDTSMPRSEDFSWGLIRLVDRLGVSNEYLTFGGHLDAALIDDVVVAAFTSPAPLLRRGGHSQGWDAGADAIGGFFARMMVAVDFKPGFEGSFAAAEPLTRYAAFVRDTDQRRHGQKRSDLVRRPTRPPCASTKPHDCVRRPERLGCGRCLAGRRFARSTWPCRRGRPEAACGRLLGRIVTRRVRLSCKDRPTGTCGCETREPRSQQRSL